jgi:hypothetical protein
VIVTHGIPTVRIFMAGITGAWIMAGWGYVTGATICYGIMVVIDFLPVTCIVTILA